MGKGEAKCDGSHPQDIGIEGAVWSSGASEASAPLAQMLPMPRNLVYQGIDSQSHHSYFCLCLHILGSLVHLLEIQSSPSESPSNVDVNFWEQVGYTECVTSHIKKFVFEDARGEDTELAFLKFIMERAQMLEEMRVLVDDGCSRDVVLSCLSSEGCVSADASVVVERRDVSHAWNFERVSDMSRCDPFDC
jgi:hypothetical protein